MSHRQCQAPGREAALVPPSGGDRSVRPRDTHSTRTAARAAAGGALRSWRCRGRGCGCGRRGCGCGGRGRGRRGGAADAGGGAAPAPSRRSQRFCGRTDGQPRPPSPGGGALAFVQNNFELQIGLRPQLCRGCSRNYDFVSQTFTRPCAPPSREGRRPTWVAVFSVIATRPFLACDRPVMYPANVHRSTSVAGAQNLL